MWNKIVNPKTGRKINVNSKIGKNVLRNYLNQLGGAAAAPLSAEQKAVNLNNRRKILSLPHISSVPILFYYRIQQQHEDEFDELFEKMLWNSGRSYPLDTEGSEEYMDELYNDVFTDPHGRPTGKPLVLFRVEKDGDIICTIYPFKNNITHETQGDTETVQEFFVRMYEKVTVKGPAYVLIPNKQF